MTAYDGGMLSKGRDTITDEVRAEAVVSLGRFIDDEASFESAIAGARKLSRCKWYREMLSELEDYAMPRLPYAPRDTTSNLTSALEAMSRVVLMLRLRRVYVDTTPRLLNFVGKLLGYTFLVSSVVLLGMLAATMFLGQTSWIDRAFMIPGIVAASTFGCVFLAYVVVQFAAGIHIFRVRVLRQDLRHKLKEDIWPYLDRETYETDLVKSKLDSPLQAGP